MVDREHILVAGGGVAALEAILALRDLVGHRVRLTLLSAEREYLYRPVTVAEAYGQGEARIYSLPEIIAEREHDRFVWDALERVEPQEQTVITAGGERLGYDRLIVATGARFRDWLPGALTFRGRADVDLLSRVVQDLDSGRARSLALAVPARQTWPLPLYELALMSASRLRGRGAHAVHVSVVTPEDEPLELFGSAAARVVAQMIRALGIAVHTSSTAAHVGSGELMLVGGNRLRADRVVTIPIATGPKIGGLPHNKDGFLPVDEHGRVRSVADVFAAGDATSHRLKQGGLATQQADVVAEAIAAELGVPGTPRPYSPVLRGLLLTGSAPLYLRAEGTKSVASGQPLWWPPAKIAGRYLGPFLAHTSTQPLEPERLTDRAPALGRPASEAEFEEPLELALLLADGDADRGDFTAALSALEAAEAIQGMLPPEYEAKRRRWRSAARSTA